MHGYHINDEKVDCHSVMLFTLSEKEVIILVAKKMHSIMFIPTNSIPFF